MQSVTERIKNIEQPYGGYVRIRDFEKTSLEDEELLGQKENIHASLVGLVVDYLTRYEMTGNTLDAFKISCMGAKKIGETQTALALLNKIKGLDDESIMSACKLSGFDVCIRNSTSGYKPVEKINPDKVTINNIRIMVRRCLVFWKQYGPVLKDGFTFEGAFTELITSGDGDYLTQDTLWELKVNKSAPTSKHSLQLLVYYLLGQESVHKEFHGIKFIGIYNPRVNIVYRFCVANLSEETILKVKEEVIGLGAGLERPQTREESRPNRKEMVSVNEAEAMLNVKRARIYALIKSGTLPAVKCGYRYEISRQDIIKYRRRRRSVALLITVICIGCILIQFCLAGKG